MSPQAMVRSFDKPWFRVIVMQRAQKLCGTRRLQKWYNTHSTWLTRSSGGPAAIDNQTNRVAKGARWYWELDSMLRLITSMSRLSVTSMSCQVHVNSLSSTCPWWRTRRELGERMQSLWESMLALHRPGRPVRGVRIRWLWGMVFTANFYVREDPSHDSKAGV